MERATPQTLIYLYDLLPDADKAAFRHLLGGRLTAEQLFLTLDALSLPDQERFSHMLEQGFAHVAVPKLILEAIRIARKYPEAEEAELAKLVEERAIEYYSDAKRLAEAEVKKARDRKPDETRLERGKIILQANRDGVSWKNMPSHVFKNHPDWFPQYRDQRPTLEERRQLQERLRKMARDAEKQAE